VHAAFRELRALGALQAVTAGDHVSEHVLLEHAGAHTPGHLFVRIVSGGEQGLMLGHMAVPSLTDGRAAPATLAPELARRLLRDELGFEGVSVTDALDMGALYADVPGDDAETGLPAVAVGAALAGVDLLLTLHEPAAEDAALEALIDAARTGLLHLDAVRDSAGRIRALRASFAGLEPPVLSVVGCADHLALAREIAERSVTLIRDRDGLLPVHPRDFDRVVVTSPRPVDLTPADTSSYLQSGLAEALRAVGLPVEDLPMALDPTAAEVDALAGRVASARTLVVVGTVDAVVHTGQAGLVAALLARDTPVIAVALRTPVDALAYPVAGTALATYGGQPPNLAALAEALTGRIPFRGRLPVRFGPDEPGGGR
jgi:beta-N-acetylhexosaminidase